MGANNSSLTPLTCILKNWDRFDPQGLKKTHLVFLCDTAWPRYPLEDGEWWPVGGSLKYNTVLPLDRFCKEQGKWVEVAYVLPFFSLQNMPDLCPKGIDLGMKPSAPSCPPTYCPRTRGSKLNKLKAREPPSERLLWSQWKPKLRFKLLTWRSKQLLSQYDLRLFWFQ